MKLCDIFSKDVVTALPDEPLSAIARKMQEYNVGDVVVIEDRRPVGIITDRDLALALGCQDMSRRTPVEEVMTRHVVAVPEDMGVFTATRFIREAGVRRLPIVDRHDRVVGMVTLDDLLLYLGREMSNLAIGIENEVRVG